MSDRRGEIEALRLVVEGAPVKASGDGGSFAAAGADDPGECPVVALGHHDGRYFFLSASGEKRMMDVRGMTATGLLALFAGDSAWLIQHYPAFDKNGVPLDDFALRSAVGYLIRACERAGVYDPDLRLRGRGVWRGLPGADGRPAAVVHVGDRIARVDGGGFSWHPAGWREGSVVYPSAPRMDPPNFDAPATAEDGQKLLAHFRLWRFVDPADADLFLGWSAVALLSGYPKWRAHAQVAAAHGAGKTALCELLEALCGSMGVPMNGYSEAGVRQALSDEARVVLLDEAEGDATGAMQAVIGLIRRMSGSKGAAISKGSPGGMVQRFTVIGCALMAGINPPPLTPQDRSRILRFDILKATSDPEAAARVDAAIAWARTMSGRFRARVLLGAQRFAAAVDAYRAALMAAKCDGRQADVLAVALAGRDLLLHDTPPDSDSMEEVVASLGPRIGAMLADDDEDDDARQCLNHLMTFIPDHWRSGTRATVGDLLAVARTEHEGSGENGKALRTYGLRVAIEPDGPVLLVANRHGGLRRIFHGTRWAEGGWIGTLRRLGTDVTATEKTERFAGGVSRATRIPARYLPEIEESY
ncbi:hypothetical protein ACIU1J_01870 [Azospirillum doebereinerae]|uniref:hypothetical protein n=1 Tax=Azospirillum doebereinerae TaxID=92933 RepID=UPI001EE5E940|nr:hypothetical protein [Azospirillum doebereinerae]MCG5240079.1 hypothetical protein [Azospirillum doebereinerae]